MRAKKINLKKKNRAPYMFRYGKEHYKTYSVRIKRKYRNVIRYVDTKENKTGYFRELIRQEMLKENNNG